MLWKGLKERGVMEKPKRMTINQEKFGEALAKLDMLQTDVSEIKERLFGNGKPGLIVDLVSMGEKLVQLQDICTKQSDSINGLQKQVPTKWIVKHWKEIVFIAITSFIFIHSIIPPNLSLWDWLSKLF